jgi:hypothetical protein
MIMRYYIASCVFTAQFPELSGRIQGYVREALGLSVVRCCVPRYRLRDFEDRMPEGLRGRPVRLIQTEYAREARLGDTIELQSAGSADGYCLCGQQNGAKLFRLSLAYGSGKEADGHPSA